MAAAVENAIREIQASGVIETLERTPEAKWQETPVRDALGTGCDDSARSTLIGASVQSLVTRTLGEAHRLPLDLRFQRSLGPDSRPGKKSVRRGHTASPVQRMSS